MAETQVNLFGTLHLSSSAGSFAFGPSPTADLLGYLALYGASGRAIPRAIFCEKLWPYLPAGRARLKLNDTLYRLRQKLGRGFSSLFVDSISVSLVNVTVDVVEFKRLAGSGHVDGWRAAIELYTGELLDGIDAEWLLVPRVALRDTYLTTLAKLCAALIEAGSESEALGYAHCWMLSDPYNEDPYRLVMRLAGRLGRHAEALQTYDRLVTLLDEEFQSTPLPETRALANAIRAEYHAVPRSYLRALTLAGRHSERAALLHLVEQARAGHGRMALLEGEAGIGKTRLLEAIADGASWREVRVTWGTLTMRGPNTVLAPLDQALHAALAGMWAASMPGDLPSDTTELSETIAALSAAGPHVLMLDNLHLADPRFWQALESCAAQIATSRLLLILSYRGSRLRARAAAWKAACALDRAWAMPRIILQELRFDEGSELARAINPSLDDAAARALYKRSGGHPGLIEALLAADAAGPLPEPARALIEERLAGISAAARQALEVLSVAGPSSTPALLCRVADAAVLSQIPALIADRWIVEREGAYRFRQEAAREHMYALIATERRIALHRRFGLVLEQLRQAPEQCARHYEQAEDWPSALHVHQAAAEELMRARDYAPALQSYGRALAVAQPAGAGQQVVKLLRSAWEAAAQHSAQVDSPSQPISLTVRLAHAAAPLGRPLKEAEFVTVRWTVHAGETDDTIARTAGKVALRRNRLARLIAEARAQSAAPTDGDLAQALNVTERTIAADIQALRAAGHTIATRRRKMP